MTLLQARDERRRARRLALRAETRLKLRQALSKVLPGERLLLFGSITRDGAFNEASDIDIALFDEPCGKSLYLAQAELEEWMRRPVDLVILAECHFKERLLREGEEWTL